MRKSFLFIGILLGTLVACDTIEPPIYGCTNGLASNYNSSANIDDESCSILGCQDIEASNYNPDANVACDTINPSNDCCCYSTYACFEDPSAIVKKVLIEDFTGHKCQNCPEAAEELHNLQSLHANKVIGIAIHAGYFSEPNPIEAPRLTTDFRTEGGNTIHDFFGPEEYPTGMISRVDHPNNHLKNYSSWGTAVSPLIEQAPKLGICINEICGVINVSLLGLEDIGDSLKLVVCITEDDIIDWQTVEGIGNVEDYEHNHVLRKIVTNAMGNSIGSLAEDEMKDFNFSYTLEDNWVKGNCHAVAYVYDEITKEVLQVEELKLTE